MEQEDHNAVQAMMEYGGSFVRKLGELCTLADSDNFAKLKAAFPKYWEVYRKLASREKKS